MASKKVKYEIINHIGVIAKRENYQKEVNLISWGGRPPVYDIRNFRIGKDGEKQAMRGITLEKGDMLALKKLLSRSSLEELP